MSSTRFNYDPCRTRKLLQELTDPGKYMLNVPNNGNQQCFIEDPFIRLQKCGTNLRTNAINLESDLLGLTRTMTKDCIDKNRYDNNSVKSDSIKYSVCTPNNCLKTEQTRTTNPAWTARDLEQVDWYILPLDPQENTCFPFSNNLNTRLIERDNFISTPPCFSQLETSSSNDIMPGPYCNTTNYCGNI